MRGYPLAYYAVGFWLLVVGSQIQSFGGWRANLGLLEDRVFLFLLGYGRFYLLAKLLLAVLAEVC